MDLPGHAEPALRPTLSTVTVDSAQWIVGLPTACIVCAAGGSSRATASVAKQKHYHCRWPGCVFSTREMKRTVAHWSAHEAPRAPVGGHKRSLAGE